MCLISVEYGGDCGIGPKIPVGQPTEQNCLPSAPQDPAGVPKRF